jgi:hypothetical protein
MHYGPLEDGSLREIRHDQPDFQGRCRALSLLEALLQPSHTVLPNNSAALLGQGTVVAPVPILVESACPSGLSPHQQESRGGKQWNRQGYLQKEVPPLVAPVFPVLVVRRCADLGEFLPQSQPHLRQKPLTFHYGQEKQGIENSPRRRLLRHQIFFGLSSPILLAPPSSDIKKEEKYDYPLNDGEGQAGFLRNFFSV